MRSHIIRHSFLLPLLLLAFCYNLPASAAVTCPLTVTGGTVPCPVPVSAYQSLQDEAVQVLEAKGYPADMTPAFARNAIRAYVFARLLSIIQEDPAERSQQEQDAYAVFKNAVHDDHVAIAANAYAYWKSLDDGDPCFSGGSSQSRVYVPPNALVSLLCEAFQDKKPNQREVYRGRGATETYDALLTGSGAYQVAAVLNKLDWFAGGVDLSQGALFQHDSAAQKRYQQAMDQITGMVSNDNKIDFLTALFVDGISLELTPATVVKGLLVLGTTAWQTGDFTAIGNDLRAELAASYAAQPDLKQMANGPLTELMLVFMGQVLGPPVEAPAPVPHPCLFNSGDSCQYWHIDTADPDHINDTYAGLTPPNGMVGSDLAMRPKDGSNWTNTSELSPPAGVALWAVKVPGKSYLNGELGGFSTRLQDPLQPGVNSPLDLHIDPHSGLSVYVADNFLVQLPFNDTTGKEKPDDWKYDTVLKYRGWNGDWWKAYFVNGTFLQLRNSRPLQGLVQVAGFQQDDGGQVIQNGTYHDGYTYCKAWTTGDSYQSGSYRVYGQVDGNCLLLSRDFDLSQIAVGDVIAIGGQTRTIKNIVNCEGTDLDNLGDVEDLFIGQMRCDQNSDPGHTLDPATTNWNGRAIIVNTPLASLKGTYGGPSRWFTLRKLHKLNSCGKATTGSNLFSCKTEAHQDPATGVVTNYNPKDYSNCPNFGPSFPGHPSVVQGGNDAYLLLDSALGSGVAVHQTGLLLQPAGALSSHRRNRLVRHLSASAAGRGRLLHGCRPDHGECRRRCSR